MYKLRGIAVATVIALMFVVAASASAATTAVTAGETHGWEGQTNAGELSPGPPVEIGTPLPPNEPACSGSGKNSVSLVPGPATSPGGKGSAELSAGNGECAAQLRTSAYAGMNPGELSALGYWTYVKENNGSQAPYLQLELNLKGEPDGPIEDILFFEPPYQTETFTKKEHGEPADPEQGEVKYDTWQKWNALEGGWYDYASEVANPGDEVTSLGYILSALEGKGDAPVITGSEGYGVSLLVGYASTEPEVSNVDAFTIGFEGHEATTFNFEPTAPTAKIAKPSSGGVYSEHQMVDTEFSCADTPAGPGIEAAPGIAACTDSNGASGGSGTLDTETPGPHEYKVTAKSKDGLESTTAITYTVEGAPERVPTIRKLSVHAGPSAGGTTVLITGTSFRTVSAVKFGSTEAASFEYISETEIRAVTAASPPGKVEVTVTTARGESGITPQAHFRFGRPTVTQITPSNGPKAGDEPVTVKGSGFALGAATTFTFGAAGAASSVDCTSTTQCTMRTPPSTKARVVTVKATAAGETSSTQAPGDHYKYE